MSESIEEMEALELYAQKEERAYALFERQYGRQLPPPIKPERHWYNDFPLMALPFAVIAVAGSLLSAFRTAPVFIEIAELTVSPEAAMIEGALSMIVIDVAVVAFRYAHVFMTFRSDPDRAQITWAVRFGGIFAVLAQLIAQVYATRGIATALNQYEVTLQLLIALAAALSGMGLAYITGEILAILVVQRSGRRDKVDRAFTEANEAWRDGLNRSWAASKTKLIGRPPAADNERRQQASESVSADNADKPESVSPSVKKALTWLAGNPDAARFSARNRGTVRINRDAVNRAGGNSPRQCQRTAITMVHTDCNDGAPVLYCKVLGRHPASVFLCLTSIASGQRPGHRVNVCGFPKTLAHGVRAFVVKGEAS
jgi:hypothetical protein